MVRVNRRVSDPGQRSANLKAAQRRKLAYWFEGRHWRVASEVTKTVTAGEVTIVYDHGEFWVQEPGVFHTPTGHPGRKGFLLQEVDGEGADLPGDLIPWGIRSLRRAEELWPGCLPGGVPEEHAQPEVENAVPE